MLIGGLYPAPCWLRTGGAVERARQLPENARRAGTGPVDIHENTSGSPRVATIKKSALVAYSAARMYALVADIEAYPQFLPWCRSTRILARNGDELRASIEMAKGAVNKSFSTCNRLQANKMIEMRLIDGPFRHLEGYWRFEGLGEDACRVSLDLEFEFSSTLLRLAIGPIFNQIANTLVDSFCKRAVQIYGRG
ncbi:type II toxin-antitoxin system RatA family toxin [Thauera aminoaromatica]|uniref:type II toxin-antitoxin system RatA family toxin n=1 Tax=Thauera aminoaromatica TaxID=164330 RepID=UPI0035ADB464